MCIKDGKLICTSTQMALHSACCLEHPEQVPLALDAVLHTSCGGLHGLSGTRPDILLYFHLCPKYSGELTNEYASASSNPACAAKRVLYVRHYVIKAAAGSAPCSATRNLEMGQPGALPPKSLST